MKPLLLLLALVAEVSSAALPVAVHQRDLIGTWKDTSCAPHSGCRFRDDGVFLWVCGEQVDAGKWLFKTPSKIELIFYYDRSQRSRAGASVRHFVEIESFARHKMVVRVMPGGTKHILLKE